MSKHLLFLSHSGADTEAARLLVERIESSHYAKEHQIRVWFDNRDLRAGEKWRPQLEEAIANHSTAFAVYVGSHGIINWVEHEVDLGLSRATGNKTHYPFIPILTKQAEGSQALPPFMRQYQGVSNVENDDEQLRTLLRAITSEDQGGKIPFTDEPFVGLRAFEASNSHLFFGRKYPTTITRSNGTKFESNLGDIGELLYRLEEHRLLMVYGDSGSGKSSLIKAGLIPHYRGGELADTSQDEPDDTVWLVIETRPLRDPYVQLADDLARLASDAGLSAQDIFAIRDRIKSARRQGDQSPESEKILDAFKQIFPHKARLLLVIDQFEELFTQVRDPVLREDFIELLVYLANEVSDLNVRIVLTMRRDYYNLCSNHEQFYRLTQTNKYLVRRMKNEQLSECIIRPLALAGVKDADVFAQTVLRDVGDRPGDLALMEMALSDTWRNRASYDNDLLRVYQALGDVTGVLANRADTIYKKLDSEMQSLCAGVFIRLVQPGKTGGATRRTAYRNEFNDQQWRLIQKFGSEEYGRLIVVGSDKKSDLYAELTHEALYYQWEQYQVWLQDVAEYKQILDKVTERASQWKEASHELKERFLLTGYELGQAEEIRNNRTELLSEHESSLIALSVDKKTKALNELNNLKQKQIDDANRAARKFKWLSTGLGVALICAVISTGVAIDYSQSQKQENIRTQAATILGQFDENTFLTETELQLLWQITNNTVDFRKAVFYEAVNRHPKQFFAHNQQLENAVVRFDRKMGVEIFSHTCNNVFSKKIDRSFLEPNLLCISMAIMLRMNVDKLSFLPRHIVDVMARTTDDYQLDSLSEDLNRLSNNIKAEYASELARYIVDVMTGTTNGNQLHYLSKGLRSLGDNVNTELTTQAARHIVDVMAEGIGALDSLSEGLSNLGNNVNTELTTQAARHIVDAIAGATDDYELDSLSEDLSRLSNNIKAEYASELARYIVDVMRTTNTYQLNSLSEGLSSLWNNVNTELTTQAARHIVDVMARTTDEYQLHNLSKSLSRLSNNIKAEYASELARHIVDVIVRTTESKYLLSSLSEGLSNLGNNVNTELTTQAARHIVDVIAGTTDDYQLDSLSEDLNRLSNNIKAEYASELARYIVDVMTGTTNGNQLHYLSKGLRSLGDNVNTELTTQAARHIVDVIAEATYKDQFYYLSVGFSSLWNNVNTELTTQAARHIVDTIAEATNTHHYLLSEGLRSLWNNVNTELTTQAARHIVDIMAGTTDAYQLYYLSQNLSSLGDNVNTELTTQAARHIVDIMAGTTDAYQLSSLSEGLSNLGDNVNTELTTQAARHIVDIIAEGKSPGIGSLSEDLRRLSNNIKAEYASELARHIVDVIVRTTESKYLLSSLSEGLSNLGNNVNTELTTQAARHIVDVMAGTANQYRLDELSIALSFFKKESGIHLVSTLITALSLPNLSESHQQTLVQVIEDITKSDFNNNIWELVNWAKSNDYQNIIYSSFRE